MTNTNQHIFHFNTEITKVQKDFFHQHGFLHFKAFLSDVNVAEIIEELKSIESFLIKEGVRKVNGIPLKFGADADGSPLIQRMAFASQFSDVLHRLLKDNRFSEILSLLNNPNSRIGEFEKDGLVVNHYVNAPGSSFKQMGWHTDSPRDIFLGSRIRPMLNVGIHLDNYPVENGGLRVLPGTHRQNFFQLFFRKKYFIDNKPDKREVGFDISAGDLTIHDGRIWHRVHQSPITGAISRRRVMYIPVVTGAYEPKTAQSATPIYHKLAQFNFQAS
jgi:ectoine hydroxylase-related dioxygenase (phytanoyl-CoA dioxygenase family)